MLNLEEAKLAGLCLEALAELVAETDVERLDELRVRASKAANFMNMAPNFGHEAAALLLREGLIRLITVNWDRGVERAGLAAGIEIRPIADAVQNGEMTDGLVILKVHGCVTKPPTLAVTQAEVDTPRTWAVGRVQGALSDGIVAFVGLGTVGLYVQEPIENLVDIWVKEGTSVLVADPVLSPGWEQVLGAAAQEVHIKSGADEFLDDLLRAVMLEALQMCAEQIQGMPQNEQWEQMMRGGFADLRAALLTSTADALNRWWRDGVSSVLNGDAFVTQQSGLWSMMTVSLLAGRDTGPIEVTGSRGRQTVATESQYFEIISEPGRPITDVARLGRARILRRIEEGVYGHSRSITVVVAGATGRFPSDSVPIDISAGAAAAADIAEGAESISMSFISAEEAVQGRMTA
jgi:hypothetical protein